MGMPAASARERPVVLFMADIITDFFSRRAKVLVLTIFTYAALC